MGLTHPIGSTSWIPAIAAYISVAEASADRHNNPITDLSALSGKWEVSFADSGGDSLPTVAMAKVNSSLRDMRQRA